MFLDSLKNIIKFSFQNFWRDRSLGIGVIFVMVIAIVIITAIFSMAGLSKFLIDKVENKVDISVYFNENVEEEKILEIKKNLESFSDHIKSIKYISREQAKEDFIEKHKDNPYYLDALKQVGYNPFLASLDIVSDTPDFYRQISDFLTQGPTKDLINKVSYYENEKVINAISKINNKVKIFGISLSLFLALLLALIVFNTIKLSIIVSKEEISTMKVVGASNWFIRGPFIVQSLIYTVIAIIISDALIFSVLIFFNPRLSDWFSGFNFLSYLWSNFLLVSLIQFLFIAVVGAFSTYLAMCKYLKI
ncbi:permease-like cell division protein FtsX [bacterium]|nr:permease-like cell division protein FtsX [bacterium]